MNILILGASNNQIDLIIAAKNKKNNIYLVDPNDNPPGKKFSFFYIQEDIRNVVSIINKIKSFSIDACISDQSDVGLLSQSIICRELNIYSITYEKALICTQKDSQINFLSKKLPKLIPASHFFDHPSDLFLFLDNKISGLDEWVVKPKNSQGSKGVFILNKEKYKEQIVNSYKESFGRGLILQKHIIGKEFSVEAYIYKGNVGILAITEKEHYPDNDCLDKRNVYFGSINFDIEKNLSTAHKQIISAIEIESSMSHAEYIVDKDNNVYLIEFAARGGGGSISGKLLPFLTGFSSVDFLIAVSLNIEPKLQFGDYRMKFAIMHFLEPNQKFPENFNPKNYYFVLHCEYKESNITKNTPDDSRDRPGYFIVTGKNLEDVNNNEKIIKELLILKNAI